MKYTRQQQLIEAHNGLIRVHNLLEGIDPQGLYDGHAGNAMQKWRAQGLTIEERISALATIIQEYFDTE